MVLVLILLTMLGVFWLLNYNRAVEQKRESDTKRIEAIELQRLSNEYYKALAGTDHTKAWVAGRRFLGFRRGGPLTTEDEIELRGDLSSMRRY